MRVDFVRSELRHIDETQADALALPIFSDERPLRGAAGLVDWRLGGRVSGWITTQRFSAAPGETLLYPDRGRLPFGRLLLFGLGDSASFDTARLQEISPVLLRALRDLGVQRFASPLPGRHVVTMDVRKQVDAWLACTRDVFLDEPSVGVDPDVVILDDTETQRATADTVGTFLRRLKANRSL